MGAQAEMELHCPHMSEDLFHVTYHTCASTLCMFGNVTYMFVDNIAPDVLSDMMGTEWT